MEGHTDFVGMGNESSHHGKLPISCLFHGFKIPPFHICSIY